LKKAKLIEKVSKRAIEALTKLRELSDGFLYKETESSNRIDCEFCKGSGLPNEQIMPGAKVCLGCEGKGFNFATVRTAVRTSTPKDDETEIILDEHSDIGRLVIYAGFEDSIDRCVDLAIKNGWDYVRADGRGWITSLKGNLTQLDMLREFQKPVDSPYSTERTERFVFIGNAGAAGTGLTLTASPTILYYSNDFNAENRIQSEDRIHRIGQANGTKIIDLINLPTDQIVLDNLKKKRELQAMTLGDIFTGWGDDFVRD
jgi:SNF2 family DNA or RNA helicase